MRLPRPLPAALVLLLLLPGQAAQAAPYQRPGVTERVSVGADGAEHDVDVTFAAPDVSADGSVVTFTTPAPLLPDDTNEAADVYLRDLTTGVLERISVASDGAEADGGAGGSSISADGELVAFQSASTNLVPGDGNGKTDVFVRDRRTGETRIVTNGNGVSTLAAISGNGRTIAFASDATDLVSGDTNGVRDIFVARLDDGAISRVSVGDDEVQANALAEDAPAISHDGTLVAFNSPATNLIAGDTNARSDTFVRDLSLGTTERISVSSEEIATRESVFSSPSMSADGRFVTFDTWSWTLVPNDTNGDVGPVFVTFALGFDVYVRDRLGGTTHEVTLTSAGVESDRDAAYPVLSPDGRHVAFTTPSVLAPVDTGGSADIYLHDLRTGATELVSVGFDGAPGDAGSFLTSLSSDASTVAFQSSATNLIEGDWNGRTDVFVRHRGAPTDVAALSGVVTDGILSVSGAVNLSGTILIDANDPAGDASEVGAALGADLTGASISHRPEQDDLLVRLMLANMPELRDPRVQAGAASTLGVAYGLGFSTSAGSFQVRATQIAPASSPRIRDDAGTRLTPSSDETWRFELLRCEATCSAIRTLKGGGGTGGDDVRMAVPLDALSLPFASSLSGIRAFTAPADAATPAPFDTVALTDTALGGPSVLIQVLRDGQPVGTPKTVIPSAGAFQATFPMSGMAPGAYAVRASVCFAARCGGRTVPISLP